MAHINIPQSKMHVCHIPTSHYDRHMSVKYSNHERSTSIIVFSSHREKKTCVFATCGKHLHNRIIWGGFGPIKLIQPHYKYMYQDKKERVVYLSTYMYQEKKERVMYLSTYMYQDKKERVVYLSTYMYQVKKERVVYLSMYMHQDIYLSTKSIDLR